MATKLSFGDRDFQQGVLKNYKFTIFADLAAANAAVGTVFGFAYLLSPGSLYYNQNGLSWQSVGGKGVKGDTGLTGPVGPMGGPGPTGPAGPQGSVWYTGAVAPVTLHVNGDFYLNSVNGDVYEQISGAWVLVANIKGPIGNTGPAGSPGGAGPTGPAGPAGPPGNGGAYQVMLAGDPALITQSSAANPSAAPIFPIIFHVNTTTGIFFQYISAVWVQLPHGFYIDTNIDVIYEMSASGWVPVLSYTAPIPYARQNASFTMVRAGPFVYLPVRTNVGPVTVTLPPPTISDIIIIKDIDGMADVNPITVIAAGTDKLDGVTTGSFVIDTKFGSARISYETFDSFPITTTIIGWWLQDKTLGLPRITTLTAATTLARRFSQIALVDSTGGSFTLTLPASPLEGDMVEVKDATGQAELFPVVIAAAGTFETSAPVIDAKYMDVTLVYRGGTWRTMWILRNTDTAPVTVSAATTLTPKRRQTILLNSTGSAFTLTLPVSPREEDVITLKDSTGQAELYPVTLAAAAGFESSAPLIDAKYMTLEMVFRGTTWRTQADSRRLDGNVTTVSSTALLNPARDQLVLLDSTAAAFTLTLPVTPLDGDIVRLKDSTGQVEVNPITIATGNSFDDGTPVLTVPYEAVAFRFQVGIWYRLADYRTIPAPVVTLAAATTLLAKREQTILYNVSGGAFAITLPASPREKDRVRLKELNGSTNVLTVTGTVDGTVNPTFNTAYAVIFLEYLSGAWRRM